MSAHLILHAWTGLLVRSENPENGCYIEIAGKDGDEFFISIFTSPETALVLRQIPKAKDYACHRLDENFTTLRGDEADAFAENYYRELIEKKSKTRAAQPLVVPDKAPSDTSNVVDIRKGFE